MVTSGADVPVLMYHEITATASGSARLAVSPRSFAAQVAYLAETGYSSVTAGELAAALAGRFPLPTRPVVLTFDDGFADFHEVALPVLEKHGFRATLFMTTSWIREGGHKASPAPGRMLSWAQLKELVAAGMEVGGHSHHHLQLDQLSRASVRGELAMSKQILEDGLSLVIRGMAYPFGYSNAKVRSAAEDLGYSYACAVANRCIRSRTDPYAVPRLTVSRSTRLSTYQQVAECRNLHSIYLKDRLLTQGWAVVRRARALPTAISDRNVPR